MLNHVTLIGRVTEPGPMRDGQRGELAMRYAKSIDLQFAVKSYAGMPQRHTRPGYQRFTTTLDFLRWVVSVAPALRYKFTGRAVGQLATERWRASWHWPLREGNGSSTA